MSDSGRVAGNNKLSCHSCYASMLLFPSHMLLLAVCELTIGGVMLTIGGVMPPAARCEYKWCAQPPNSDNVQHVQGASSGRHAVGTAGAAPGAPGAPLGAVASCWTASASFWKSGVEERAAGEDAMSCGSFTIGNCGQPQHAQLRCTL